MGGFAADRRVTFDNRGVGASTGSTPRTIQELAKDAITFIRALGLDLVDIHGFSMGGMIAQVVVEREPQLVRKLILTGTGPAGGEGIKNVTWTWRSSATSSTPTTRPPPNPRASPTPRSTLVASPRCGPFPRVPTPTRRCSTSTSAAPSPPPCTPTARPPAT
ncbi:alpha/beta hydrolase [Streptomyces sp. NPDC013172]|uniref:alpha/beta fold hydrolase n=1 Tax=Streptomyces sp. NPDC013172 TaxID=3155009 RepID=UPI0033CC7D82